MNDTDQIDSPADVAGPAQPELDAEDYERIKAMQLASEMRAVRLATGAGDEAEEDAPAAEVAQPGKGAA